MKYVYPAIFEPSASGGYDVVFPDIPRCYTCGNNLINSMEMAEDVLAMTLFGLENDSEPINQPSSLETITCEAPSFATLIRADTELYRRKIDKRAVKKTLTIPAWLNEQAEKAHVNFSGVLQEALKNYLQV